VSAIVESRRQFSVAREFPRLDLEYHPDSGMARITLTRNEGAEPQLLFFGNADIDGPFDNCVAVAAAFYLAGQGKEV
jgi:hypothetical protein